MTEHERGAGPIFPPPPAPGSAEPAGGGPACHDDPSTNGTTNANTNAKTNETTDRAPADGTCWWAHAVQLARAIPVVHEQVPQEVTVARRDALGELFPEMQGAVRQGSERYHVPTEA